MKKHTAGLSDRINVLCLTTFAALALAVTMPAPVHAANTQGVPSGALPSGTVAIVNGVSISQAQLENALRASRQPDTPQIRQAIRQELVARELFRQNAEKQHYDTKPEVQEVVNAAKVNAETQLYLKDNIHPEPVTDAQVKARYDDIVGSLGKEEYKPRIISVADEATANTVLAQLKAGSAFDALARQYSVAPSKAAGGEMAWISFKLPFEEGKTQGLPLPVAQAVAQLSAGAVTPVAIPVTQGSGTLYVIAKLDAKRPTVVPGFDQARDTIRQQLQALAVEKASAQFVAGQLKDATIQQ
jgi:parvulin-like peptidyl-prolyl isomerase